MLGKFSPNWPWGNADTFLYLILGLDSPPDLVLFIIRFNFFPGGNELWDFRFSAYILYCQQLSS